MSNQSLTSRFTAFPREPRERSLRAPVVLALATAALTAGGTDVAAAAVAPVPCAKAAATYICAFDTRSGAPVQQTSGRVVAKLSPGLHRVVCPRVGGSVRVGPDYNNNWALTAVKNRKAAGWVNALYARGGANNGRFAQLPVCARAHGRPPGTAVPAPVPAPPPVPVPSPVPGPGPAVPAEWSNGPVNAPAWKPPMTTFSSINCGSKAIPTGLQPETVNNGWTARTQAIVNVIRGPLFGWTSVGGAATGARTGHVSNSYHYCGRAIDAFAPGVRSGTPAAGAGLSASWRMANWAAHNAPSLKVSQVIFYDRIWTADLGGWRTYTHPGGSGDQDTLQHRDHVHISVY